MGRRPSAITIKKDRFDIVLKGKDISIQKLADATGYTRQGLSRAINSEKIDPQTLDNLSKHLNISPGFFTGEEALVEIKADKKKEFIESYFNDRDLYVVIDRYLIPTYEYYRWSLHFKKSNETPLSERHPEYGLLKQAYIKYGERLKKLGVKELYYDQSFVDENFNYLVVETYSFMHEQVKSVKTHDKRFQEYLDKEAYAEYQLEQQIAEDEATFADIFDVIEPAEDSDS